MGDELLTEGDPPSFKSYTEQFNEAFPYYLHMGMTAHQYWEEDATLVKAYRKAYELKQSQENYSAWLQGAYVYDALCAVSPVLHAFAKKGAKPIPYLKEPYNLNGESASADKKATNKPKHKKAKTDKEIQEIQALNASAKFASYMSAWNRKYTNEKGGEINGDRQTSN